MMNWKVYWTASRPEKTNVIDACHSGEVDKEEFQQVTINQADLA